MLPAGTRCIKWMAGCLALALLAWAGIAGHGRAARLRFAQWILGGYERNVSLTPILAPLEARLHQAMIPDIAKSASSVNPRLFRILEGHDTEDDRYFITGTHWTQAAYLDDYKATALGAEAWANAVGRVMDKPETSTEACANRLRNWPPALFHFNEAHVFDRKLLARVVKQIENDAARVGRTLSRMPASARLEPAAALYEAGVHFRALPASRRWRKTAEKTIGEYLEAHQKSDGSMDGDLGRSVAAIEAVMPSLAAGYRAGISPSRELAAKVQRLLEILMYALDMNGCLPFAASEEDQVNRREWLFWGARVFHRPDFAWVAYGGLDALETRPPSKTSQGFPDMGLYVMRKNWEIRRFQYRGEGNGTIRPTASMSHTMSIDARRGSIELFAFGERQVRLNLPSPVHPRGWRVGERGIVFQGTLGAEQLTVVHLFDADAWIVRRAGQANDAGLAIASLRFPFRALRDGAATCPIQPSVAWDWNTGLRMKGFGSVCLRTDGNICRTTERELAVSPSDNADAFTVVITGSSTAGGKGDERAAEDRPVTIAGDDCVIGGDETQSSPTWLVSIKEAGVFLNGSEL